MTPSKYMGTSPEGQAMSTATKAMPTRALIYATIWDHVYRWTNTAQMQSDVDKATDAIMSLLPAQSRAEPQAQAQRQLTVAPEIYADILAEAKEHAEEIEAYVSEQMRDEMLSHDFDAPDDAEASMVFTFGHYRKLGRIVSLLRDLSLSNPPVDASGIRARALEEAARVAAERYDSFDGPQRGGYNVACLEIAEAIRALSSTAPVVDHSNHRLLHTTFMTGAHPSPPQPEEPKT